MKTAKMGALEACEKWEQTNRLLNLERGLMGYDMKGNKLFREPLFGRVEDRNPGLPPGRPAKLIPDFGVDI